MTLASCITPTILEMNVESYRRKAALKRKRGPGDRMVTPRRSALSPRRILCIARSRSGATSGAYPGERDAEEASSRETGISRRTINKMLTHENPPGYGPRPPHYPKLGPYISAIDRVLHDPLSMTPAADVTIQDIVERLRRSEGFAGSYDSVRNYIRHRARDDESAWEQSLRSCCPAPKSPRRRLHPASVARRPANSYVCPASTFRARGRKSSQTTNPLRAAAPRGYRMDTVGPSEEDQ